MYQKINLEIKNVFAAQALYEAIETQLEGMAVDSQEKDYLLAIRARLEQLIKENQ